MERKNVLIVDDEMPMRELLTLYLTNEGYGVEEARNGRQAIQKIKETAYCLILLDVMMPDKDGFDTCLEIRGLSTVPIIMITARNQLTDKVTGLRLGADDYITKPFEQKELIARMEALLRRNDYKREEGTKQENTLYYKGLILERQAHQAYYLDKELLLTPKEYAILELLLVHKNRVFSRDHILELVWGYDFIGDYRSVDSHIKHLRDKLTEAGISGKDVIQTVWGVGYKVI